MNSGPRLRSTFASIDLEKLCANLTELRSMVAPEEFFCPMVKANAYGHGAIEVSKKLVTIGVNHLGVALVEEGVQLRVAGLDKVQILVFGPTYTDVSAHALLAHKLTPVLSSWEEMKVLDQNLPLNSQYPVHIKFDTGMHRLGFSPAEVIPLRKYFDAQKKLRVQGLCTHLSDGEDLFNAEGYTQTQLRAFRHILSGWSGEFSVHALNSAALVARYQSGNELSKGLGARPGISLYGVCPEILGTEEGHADPKKPRLHGVLQVHSSIVNLHRIDKGHRVSYNGRWQAPRPSVIGTVAFGYADGFPRRLSNKGVVLYRGQRVPVIGTVCMDYILVDITDVATPPPILGEEVVVIGQQQDQAIAADEIATLAETISYEIFTGIASRVPREYLSGNISEVKA